MLKADVRKETLMAIFNTIKNNKDTAAVIGDNNIVTLSKRLSQVAETSITTESKNWDEIVEQIKSIQKVLKEIPDEHEEMVNQKLIPTIAKAREEAAKLKEDPAKEKKGFIESFKSFCDLANTVSDVAVKVAPYLTAIATLIGVAVK